MFDELQHMAVHGQPRKGQPKDNNTNAPQRRRQIQRSHAHCGGARHEVFNDELQRMALRHEPSRGQPKTKSKEGTHRGGAGHEIFHNELQRMAVHGQPHKGEPKDSSTIR